MNSSEKEDSNNDFQFEEEDANSEHSHKKGSNNSIVDVKEDNMSHQEDLVDNEIKLNESGSDEELIHYHEKEFDKNKNNKDLFIPGKEKKFNSDNESSSNEEEEEYSSNDIYEVEAIIGHRKRKGKNQYLIKWLGYPSSQNTWENEEDTNCPDLIKQYWESSKKKINKLRERLGSKIDPHEKDKNTKETKKGSHHSKLPFKQYPLPDFPIIKSKYPIQKVINHKLKKEGISYTVQLSNGSLLKLRNVDIKTYDPRIFIDYLITVV